MSKAKKRRTTICRFCRGEIVFLQGENGQPVAVDPKTVKDGDVRFVKATGHVAHTDTCEELREYLKERES